MNDAQFNALMALLQKAGDGASQAFIWWIVSDKILPVFAWIIILISLFFLGYKLINKALTPKEMKIEGFLKEKAYSAVTQWWLYGTNDKNSTKAYEIYKALQEECE